MRISKTELRLILVFGGLLIFVALYFLVYNPTLEENDVLEAEINALKPQLEELRTYEVNYDTYVQNIEDIRANIAAQLVAHPSKIENEEFLKWMIDWENANDLDIASVSFNGTNSISQFPLYVTGEAGEVMAEVDAGRISMSATATYSYDAIKNAINAVYAYPQSTALDSLTLTYSAETGELAGNITLSKYYINYPGAPYVPVPMPTVPIGNTNPFGSVEVAAQPAGDEAQDEAAE